MEATTMYTGNYSVNAEQFETYRPLLFATTYKMTKSVSDTEDILQDVLADFLNKDVKAITSVKSYLAKSVINRSLTSIDKKKQTHYTGIDLPEPFTEFKYEPVSQYDVSYGLLILLQKLTPQERAVFILRESFDYDNAEIAEALELSPDNCRQLLHRAKEKIETGKVRFKTSAADNQAFSDAFMQASASGDIAKFIGLLKKDMVIYSDGGGKVAAAINPIYGLENCMKFLSGMNSKRGHELAFNTRSINGHPGIVFYQKETGVTDSVVILAVEDDAVSAMYIIRNPDKFAHV